MYFAIPVYKAVLPELNEREHTLCDLRLLVSFLKIRVKTAKLYGVKSVLVETEQGFIIYVDKSLRGLAWQFAVWHEIGHFLLHGLRECGTPWLLPEKEEFEADAFALMAMFPLSKFHGFISDYEIRNGFIRQIIKKRVYLVEHFGH